MPRGDARRAFELSTTSRPAVGLSALSQYFVVGLFSRHLASSTGTKNDLRLRTLTPALAGGTSLALPVPRIGLQSRTGVVAF